MTVDRIKSDQGYKIGNLRMAKNLDNATKTNKPEIQWNGMAPAEEDAPW